MIKFVITDIQGQAQVFNLITKDSKGNKVFDTLRVNARGSVTVEMEEEPRDLTLAEKKGYIMVKRTKVANTVKKSNDTAGEVK